MTEHFDTLETRDAETRERAQLAALRSQLAYAKANSPAYARLLTDIDPGSVRYWALFTTVFAGLTMVSNLKFYSFKAINLRKSVPFIAVLGAALVVALTALQPPLVFFGGFVAYAISGYVVSAWIRMRRHRTGATH